MSRRRKQLKQPATAADGFLQAFRQEHRMLRDALFELFEAFSARDLPRVRMLMEVIEGAGGPHLRYEEETLYPSLAAVVGEAHVGKLLSDHDRLIAAARRLAELSASTTLDAAEVTEADGLLREMLPLLSDCEGVSLMVERLPEHTVRAVLASRAQSLDEGLDLMTWARYVRGRRAASA